MPDTPEATRRHPFTARDTVFLGMLSAAGFLVGLVGIYHYGYMGQDFGTHRGLILAYPGSFNYGLTNPPGLYWFGSLLHGLVGPAHYLEAIALAFLILNTLALWILYRLLWGAISATPLRWACAAFATFVPFRMIHSVVLAADAFTFPAFALVAFLALRLLGNPRRGSSWLGLSLALTAGMLVKYTFAGLLPPVALIAAVAFCRPARKAAGLRWGGVAVLALLLPAAVFLLEMRACERQGSDITTGQWLPKGAPSVMRWSDILELKASDVKLLSAPGYLEGQLYGRRNYSYIGLVHVSAFTDVLGYFQPPADTVPTAWGRRTQEPMPRERSALSQHLQVASVRWCLPFTALAIAGTALVAFLGAASLVQRRPLVPDAAGVLTALSLGYYSLVFFSLHRLGDPYTPGFWLPRLILPALLVFYCLGFVAVDWSCARLGRGTAVRWAVAGYTLVACALFAGFLI